MDSILEFWYQMTANPLLFVAVALTLGVILVNGWTDAPNAIATCVVTRCMPPRAAILMAALFNFLGVFVMTLFNATVAETITKMVDFGSDPNLAIISLSSALFAIVLWATLAWVFGIPTSESHALIAGLTGSAIALHNSLEGVNGGEWIKVICSIGISVALGFGLGWLMIVCSVVMAAGTAMGGKKIINSVGMDMVKLEKYQGFPAEIAAALSLLICSVCSLPVSTTHAKTTSIMGVGVVKRVSAINFGVVQEMVLTWVLTFPGCRLVVFLMTKLVMRIFT